MHCVEDKGRRVALLLGDVCLVSYVAFPEMVSLEGRVRSGGIARESGGVAFAVFGVGGILVSEGGLSRCRMDEIDSSMVSVKVWLLLFSRGRCLSVRIPWLCSLLPGKSRIPSLI